MKSKVKLITNLDLKIILKVLNDVMFKVLQFLYARIEQNPDRATIAQAKAISDFLKVPLDELFEVANCC